MNKILVSYFSASGQTKKLASNMAKALDADIVEIEPVDKYSNADLNWNDSNSRSSKESRDLSLRPAIIKHLSNLDAYDYILVGFPIWWYRAPNIINTFLENYDLNGKIIIPFATSGGNGMGSTNDYLKSSCHGAQLLQGKRMSANETETNIIKWFKEVSNNVR